MRNNFKKLTIFKEYLTLSEFFSSLGWISIPCFTVTVSACDVEGKYRLLIKLKLLDCAPSVTLF